MIDPDPDELATRRYLAARYQRALATYHRQRHHHPDPRDPEYCAPDERPTDPNAE
jgi:hypothetical protein